MPNVKINRGLLRACLKAYFEGEIADPELLIPAIEAEGSNERVWFELGMLYQDQMALADRIAEEAVENTGSDLTLDPPDYENHEVDRPRLLAWEEYNNTS